MSPKSTATEAGWLAWLRGEPLPESPRLNVWNRKLVRDVPKGESPATKKKREREESNE